MADSKKAAELRQLAAECRARSRESYERSDTDGCLSQWGHDLSAQQYEAQAEIVEAGGKAQFRGLYQGERRVRARIVTAGPRWRSRDVWLLDDAEQAAFGGRKFVPYVGGHGTSRVQKSLGLCERFELDRAEAILSTGGSDSRGLAGCVNTFVAVVRRGDKWGAEAELVREPKDGAQ